MSFEVEVLILAMSCINPLLLHVVLSLLHVLTFFATFYMDIVLHTVLPSLNISNSLMCICSMSFVHLCLKHATSMAESSVLWLVIEQTISLVFVCLV